MKKMTYIIVILLFFFINIANANDSNIEYFVAKNLYSQKEYTKSYFLLNRLVENNHPYDKVVQKAKIYMSLINYKLGKAQVARLDLKNFIKLYGGSKYMDHACYLYAVVTYSAQKSAIEKFFPINRYKKDQTYTKKSLKFLKKVKNEKYQRKIDSEIKILDREIKKHDLYVAEYYLKKHNYIAALNRVNTDEEFDLSDKYAYRKLYILLKSCNALGLKDIAEKILANIENL